MSAATVNQHDLEALLRVVATRDFLTAIAEGRVLPTSGALTNLAGVLETAAGHQEQADAKRRGAVT